uniref:CCHC-type domain-containing protein n=1 Tax=Tanacetum cinerariifolium TaxID=118510 RepID=A0A699IXR0_TANCI|nr:hypothetical protein [Tanacetum cinerariifolium]
MVATRESGKVPTMEALAKNKTKSISGPCVKKCGNFKRRGHQTRDCWTSVPKGKQRPSVAKQKAKVTYYECGGLGHYKRECPILKFQNLMDKYWKGEAREDSSVTTFNVNV